MDKCFTDREPLKNRRPPYNKGWSRCFDKDAGCVIWRFWQPVGDRVMQYQCAVSEIEIAMAGRWVAARAIRRGRNEMRLAIAEHLKSTNAGVQAAQRSGVEPGTKS